MSCLVPSLDHKEKLGIVSYGLSVTTMEEVFMKVGEGVDETAIQETLVIFCLILI